MMDLRDDGVIQIDLRLLCVSAVVRTRAYSSVACFRPADRMIIASGPTSPSGYRRSDQRVSKSLASWAVIR